MRGEETRDMVVFFGGLNFEGNFDKRIERQDSSMGKILAREESDLENSNFQNCTRWQESIASTILVRRALTLQDEATRVEAIETDPHLRCWFAGGRVEDMTGYRRTWSGRGRLLTLSSNMSWRHARWCNTRL